MKLDGLDAVPAGVVTEIGPLVAPVGTVVEIVVSETAVNPAVTPLNVTADAPVKFEPVIVTAVPTGPELGLTAEIDGGATTVKLEALVPVPLIVVTETGPVVEPAGTLDVSWVSETMVNPAVTPLNETADAPVKFEPVIVTAVPTGPDVGLKPSTEGGGRVTVKVGVTAGFPPNVVTETGPVVALDGTLAVICVSESTVNEALTPSKVTLVAPVNPEPVIVTAVPAGPDVGSIATIDGRAVTV